MRKTFLTLIAIVTCSLVYPLTNSFAQGTAFTYQGRLNDGSNPAQGWYDLRFTVFDSSVGGAAVGGPLTNSAVAISNGLFTVGLDFGTGVFNGDARWLEIAVRTNGVGTFTTLTQRQVIASAPYAITAGEATSGNIARLSVSNTTVTALGVPVVTSGFITGATVTRGGSGYITPPSVTVNDSTGSGAVITATISNGAVASLTVQNAGSGYSAGAMLTIGAPPSNAYQVFASTNYFPGVNTMTNPNNTIAGNFFGNGAGLTNLNFWRLGGNAGTTPGTNFLGTTDNQPLELRANGLRALRLEPSVISAHPNVIGGSPANTVGIGISGATIGGGGATNPVSSFYSVLSGLSIGFTIVPPSGPSNQINSESAVIAGGVGNLVGVRAENAAVGGGLGNRIFDFAGDSVIAGGAINQIAASNSFFSAISGGVSNTIAGASDRGVIAGGDMNTIQPQTSSATIGGGELNAVTGDFGTVPGGARNSATNFAFAAGRRAKANHAGTFVWADSTDADLASTAPNQFLIRSSGGVGIGTASPQGDLHVNGNTVLQGLVTPSALAATNLLNLGSGVTADGFRNGISFFEGGTSSAMSFGYDGVGGAAQNALRIYNTSASPLFTFQASGNLGAGTTNPLTILHAVDAGDAQISIQSGDTGGHRWALQSSGVSGSVAFDASFQVIDRTLNKSRLYIGTNGSIGIGTGSSTVPLTIRATGSATEWLTLTSTSDVARWQINEFGGGLNIAQSFVTDGRLFLANNGNAGIGTITPTNKLHVNGGISATAFVNTSDRNAKENFAPVNGRAVLDKVAALPISTWNYKEMRDGRHMGPMAQDFHAAFGLGGSDTTITTVDPDGVALAAIQGLNELLKEKDRKIADMEERLRKLENVVCALSDRANPASANGTTEPEK